MFPKLIDTGGFYLPTYGVLVAIAFLVAIWLTGKLAAQGRAECRTVTNLAIYCALAGMAGAKLLMFVFDWRTYLLNPSRDLHDQHTAGGRRVSGRTAARVLFAFLYMRRNGLPGLLTADVFAPGLALGHAIGRLGCFAAGCCWGSVCHRPWAITFTNPDAHELTGVPLGVPLHPAQLYESLAELSSSLSVPAVSPATQERRDHRLVSRCSTRPFALWSSSSATMSRSWLRDCR